MFDLESLIENADYKCVCTEDISIKTCSNCRFLSAPGGYCTDKSGKCQGGYEGWAFAGRPEHRCSNCALSDDNGKRGESCPRHTYLSWIFGKEELIGCVAWKQVNCETCIYKDTDECESRDDPCYDPGGGTDDV